MAVVETTTRLVYYSSWSSA